MSDSPFAILSASTGPLALFLDFDGTLVEIAPRPDAVVVPDDLPARLRKLYTILDGALAVITGRTIAHIDGFLPDQDFSITGSHGAEFRHQGHAEPPDPGQITDAEAIYQQLVTAFGQETGILIEPKPTGVAIHYRAAPDKKALVESIVQRVVAPFTAFHAISGKMVVEARPLTANKGAALRRLMEVKPFAERLPIFIGDDVTDEDGFAAASELGGFGIKIGEGATRARFTLSDITSVYSYFDALIEHQTQPENASASTSYQEGMVK